MSGVAAHPISGFDGFEDSLRGIGEHTPVALAFRTEGLKVGGFGNQPSIVSANAILNSSWRDTLEELEISRDPETPDFVDALTGDGGFSQLKDLRVRSYGYSEATVAHTARIAQLAGSRLRRLNLSACSLGIRSMEFLFRGTQLSNCRDLDLTGTRRIGGTPSAPQYVRLLANHEPLKSLRRLAISHLNQEELAQIVSSPHLKQLTELVIEDSALSEEDVREVMKNSIGQSLRRIRLKTTHISGSAMDVLADHQLPNLLGFEFNYTYAWHPGDILRLEPAVIRLMESDAFPSLQQLTLNSATLTELTLEAISERSKLPELRRFSFEGNRATYQHVFRVLESEHLPRLNHFSVQNCKGLRRSKKIQDQYGDRLKL